LFNQWAGQAELKLVHGALRDYLNWFVKLTGVKLTASGANWLERYKNHFAVAYGIDFEKGPVQLSDLEEINMARNDFEHEGQAFGMTRLQTKEHQRRFPLGMFVHEVDREISRSSGHEWLG
jgi:hypothetical protein